MTGKAAGNEQVQIWPAVQQVVEGWAKAGIVEGIDVEQRAALVRTLGNGAFQVSQGSTKGITQG